MKKNKWRIFCIVSIVVMVMTACGSVQTGGEASETESGSMSVIEQAQGSSVTDNPEQDASMSSLDMEEDNVLSGEARLNGKIMVFSPKEILVTEKRFFSEDTLLEIEAPENTKVYYTTDGSEPNTNAKEYTAPIELIANEGSFPNCLLLKVKAYYPDGTRSEVITHTFWAHKEIETRFETIVFSVSGEPNELTAPPNGIFYEDNVKQRGRDSEREVYIEAINSDGSVIFEQGAGVRPYGGASRDSAIKSMKLFARKEYDPDHGKFKMDVFGTIGADGKVMNKYDKLVLRNCGNDFQFAFMRDELSQRLAAQMGYTDCEAVVPAVVYLNGKYTGVYWLHENYCDDFFKDKYGDGEGRYEVLEGNEKHKHVDEADEFNAEAAREFNTKYKQLAYSDLTHEGNYKQLCDFIDVENYLQFYAFNLYIGNNDWPQNNYKCYRYYADDGEEYGEGQQDGRWRFLFHDMDYSMGLYGQEETSADYNHLADLFDEEEDSYSPLFVGLMEREDCREFFIAEMKRIMTNAMWEKNVNLTIDNMQAERDQEMVYFFEHLKELKKTDDSIWIWYDEYLKRVDRIKSFASKRKKYMEKFLEEQFGDR